MHDTKTIQLIEKECKYLEDKLVGSCTLAYTLKSEKLVESVKNNFGSDNLTFFIPLFFGWDNNSDFGLFKSKTIRDACLNYFKKNILFTATIDVLRDRYVKSLDANILEKDENVSSSCDSKANKQDLDKVTYNFFGTENNDKYIWLGPFMRSNEDFQIEGKPSLVDLFGVFLPWVWNVLALAVVVMVLQFFFL